MLSWWEQLELPVVPTPIYDSLVEEQRLARQERREEFYRRMGWVEVTEPAPEPTRDEKRTAAIARAQEENQQQRTQQD